MPGWESAAGGRTHLSQAGSKEHTLKELSHPLEELIHMWPLQHIHLQMSETASWSGVAVAVDTWAQMPTVGRTVRKVSASCCPVCVCRAEAQAV